MTGWVQPVVAAVEGNSSISQPLDCPLWMRMLCQLSIQCWGLHKALPSSHCHRGGRGQEHQQWQFASLMTSGSADFWLSASLLIAWSQQWDCSRLPYTFQSINFSHQSCFNLRSTPFFQKMYFYTTCKSSDLVGFFFPLFSGKLLL